MYQVLAVSEAISKVNPYSAESDAQTKKRYGIKKTQILSTYQKFVTPKYVHGMYPVLGTKNGSFSLLQRIISARLRSLHVLIE